MGKFIGMPKLGLTMSSGTIANWLVKEGQTVKKGQALLEIETGKTTEEFESYYDGVLVKILVHEGEDVDIGVPIAYLGQAGEQLPAVPEVVEVE